MQNYLQQALLTNQHSVPIFLPNLLAQRWNGKILSSIKKLLHRLMILRYGWSITILSCRNGVWIKGSKTVIGHCFMAHQEQEKHSPQHYWGNNSSGMF